MIPARRVHTCPREPPSILSEARCKENRLNPNPKRPKRKEEAFHPDAPTFPRASSARKCCLQVSLRSLSCASIQRQSQLQLSSDASRLARQAPLVALCSQLQSADSPEHHPEGPIACNRVVPVSLEWHCCPRPVSCRCDVATPSRCKLSIGRTWCGAGNATPPPWLALVALFFPGCSVAMHPALPGPVAFSSL